MIIRTFRTNTPAIPVRTNTFVVKGQIQIHLDSLVETTTAKTGIMTMKDNICISDNISD